MKLASVCAAGAAVLVVGLALASTPAPIHWSLTAKLQKGDQVSAHLEAAIRPGWHLYAMNEAPGGPTATRIRLAPNQPLQLSGTITEAKPRTARDPNFNMQTHFFEGKASFTIPLRAASRARAESARVEVSVRYQACNDRLCLPPQTVHVSAAVQR